MIIFWIICAAMTFIALAFVLPALTRSEESNRTVEDERKQANIAVYRDQLSELEADLRNGLVSDEQYARDRDDIERRLLEDTESTKPTGLSAPSVLGRALLFALISPLLSGLYYIRLQNPTTASSELGRILLFALIGPVVGIIYYYRFKNSTPASMSPRATAYLLGIGIPIVAIVVYLNVGEPNLIANPAPVGMPPSATSEAPPERSQEQIQANVEKLAKRLESNPNDPQGWTMLARSYSSMEKFTDAANAYAKATELTPKDADLWAEYAFATAMASGRSLKGKPMELINRALQVDPKNAKALQLAGSAAFEAKDYNKAVDYWNRVLQQVPPGSEVAQTITERINEAKTLAASK